MEYYIFLYESNQLGMKGYCIEQRATKHAQIKCRKCNKICLPGRRRRDPYGSYYCCKCGAHVHYCIRKKLDQDAVLAYFVVAIPGFLRYVSPSLVGLGDLYIGVPFFYNPPPTSLPRHAPRPRDFPSVVCLQCGAQIPKRTSSSRRGFSPHAIYCTVCGLSMRRWIARARRADRLLKQTYRDTPCVRRFLRNDILAWLENDVDRLLQSITQG